MGKPFRYILISLLFLSMSSSLKANQTCHCISGTTFATPNGQYNYVAKCWVDGRENQILEETTVPTLAEAEKKTSTFMQHYNISPSACVPYPDGSMKLISSLKD